ncbi:MAG: hypothetical protein CVV22_00725 [Ignavibacteriae bacterium HGW-Ignavibacteriae-1]|jgi:hypothetical protein|nr:MAG: hypothetical protein CVV22_00725 [Ignavibacteriae bacterium HGW-Ignavibacteriae-1]
MKYLLLIMLVLAFVFSGCEQNSTKWQDNNDRPSIAISVDLDDDEEEVNPCSTDNEQWNAFLAEVEAALGIDLSDVIVNDEPISCSILACLDENYNNHGKFVSCIAHLTNDMVKAGIITGTQKGVIQSIAGASEIGK